LLADTSLNAQIACVRREIMRRADEYLGLVATGRMPPDHALLEQVQMVAVLQTLVGLRCSCPEPATTLQPADVSPYRDRRPAGG
jgi:hypothetical protein